MGQSISALYLKCVPFPVVTPS